MVKYWLTFYILSVLGSFLVLEKNRDLYIEKYGVDDYKIMSFFLPLFFPVNLVYIGVYFMDWVNDLYDDWQDRKLEKEVLFALMEALKEPSKMFMDNDDNFYKFVKQSDPTWVMLAFNGCLSEAKWDWAIYILEHIKELENADTSDKTNRGN